MQFYKRMRRIFTIVIGLIISITLSSNAQESNMHLNPFSQLDSYLVHQNTLANPVDKSSFSNLIEKLERKRKRKSNDFEFLKSVFYKTHDKLLVKYDKLASLDETLENGRYGCLTGTITYAIILDHFDIDYDILELPNHVFLQIKLEDRVVYFESTMPRDGFSVATSEVEERINQFILESEIPLTTIGNKISANWDNEIYIKKIGLNELNALQHFNESIKNYTHKRYSKSIEHAVQAYSMYPNERNKMLMQLVLNKVRNLKCNSKKERDFYIRQFKEELSERGISNLNQL